MERIVYIDGANLHKGSLELGVHLDYKKFRGWLRQKYNAQKVYLFLGLVPKYTKLYEKLQEYGYIIIFKETLTNANGEVKGNCDAEFVLKVTSDFYENKYGSCVIVAGDGDYRCLVDFLIERKAEVTILAPNSRKCSILLKRTKAEITPLDDLYHKLSS